MLELLEKNYRIYASLNSMVSLVLADCIYWYVGTLGVILCGCRLKGCVCTCAVQLKLLSYKLPQRTLIQCSPKVLASYQNIC